MNYYRIYLSAADDPVEALDNARGIPCLECFMTETAYAEKVIEP